MGLTILGFHLPECPGPGGVDSVDRGACTRFAFSSKLREGSEKSHGIAPDVDSKCEVQRTNPAIYNSQQRKHRRPPMQEHGHPQKSKHVRPRALTRRFSFHPPDFADEVTPTIPNISCPFA